MSGGNIFVYEQLVEQKIRWGLATATRA